MTHRDRLRQWLKPASEGGLHTLAAYYKSNMLKLAGSEPSEARDEVWFDRLDPIARFIEPIAGGSERAHPEFASLCREIHECEGFQQESAILGITFNGNRGEIDRDMILQLRGLEGVRCLYHAIQCWLLLADRDHQARIGDEAGPRRALVLYDAAVLSAMTRSLLQIGHPGAAASFVEGYLNLSGPDFANRGALGEAIRRSPLRWNDDAVVAEQIVGSLALALCRIPHRGGRREALQLLEAWLGLSGEVYDDPARLRGVFDRPPWKSLPPDVQCEVADLLFTTLAHSGPPDVRAKGIKKEHFLSMLIGPRPRGRAAGRIVRRLCESWLEIDMTRVEPGQSLLAAALDRSLLLRLDPIKQGNLFCLVANSLIPEGEPNLPPRGERQGEARGWLDVLEIWLGVEDAAGGRTSGITREAVLTAQQRATAVISLARALIRRGEPGRAASLCSRWLELGEGDPDALARATRRAVRRLQAGGLLALSDAIAAFAIALHLGGLTGHAASLLDAFVDSEPDDRDFSADNMRLRGSRPYIFTPISWISGVDGANAYDRARQRTLISCCVPVVGCWLFGIAPGDPRNLLADWLGVPARAGRLAWEPLASWAVRKASGDPRSDGEIVALCEVLMDELCFGRDVRAADDPEQRAFAHRSRPVWACYQFCMMVAADRARAAGRDAEATELELRLLGWAEQFENRILAERCLENQHDSREEEAEFDLFRLGPVRWPLWPPDRLTGDRRDPERRLGASHPDGGLMPETPLQALLARPGPIRSPGSGRKGSRTDPTTIPADFLPNSTGFGCNLASLIPDGSVLIRTLFDHHGALRWWALRKDDAGVEMLARGQSRPAAYERLRVATLAFDLAVERAWDAPEGPLDPDVRVVLGHAFITPMHRGSDEQPGNPEVIVKLEKALGALADRRPSLAWLGRTLLFHAKRDKEHVRMFGFAARAGMMKSGSFRVALLDAIAKDDPDVEASWMTNPFNYVNIEGNRADVEEPMIRERDLDDLMTRLLDVWHEERRELVNHPTSPPDLDEASRRRRVEALNAKIRGDLDQASRRHVEALNAEIDLGELWDAGAGRFSWSDTDVMFQVQGPLLAAPLAWLPFGGSEMFRRVASTGSVVSLTLRRRTEARVPSPSGLPRRMLSAHWLPPADRPKMPGLPDLHVGLHQIAEDHRWEVWGLGSCPKASCSNLRTSLGATRHQFGLAVIGGHGHAEAAGVVLCDGLWHGEGDLSRLDLLILVACAVGRMKQALHGDVEGLYAHLASHGCRCALSARWPIADREAAAFVTEVVREYLKILETLPADAPIPAFTRARALNHARRKLLPDRVGTSTLVSPHLASAFEIYGLG